jgi:hypothetical protein
VIFGACERLLGSSKLVFKLNAGAGGRWEKWFEVGQRI